MISSWLDNWFTNIRSSSVLIESITIIEECKTYSFKDVKLFNTHIVWAWDSHEINHLNILRYHLFTNWAWFFSFACSCFKGASSLSSSVFKPKEGCSTGLAKRVVPQVLKQVANLSCFYYHCFLSRFSTAQHSFPLSFCLSFGLPFFCSLHYGHILKPK